MIDLDASPSPDEVLNCVAYWQSELALTHWDFTVICEAGRERHVAHCSKWDGMYCEGELYFDHTRIPRRELDAIVVHELACHPLLWPIATVAETMAGKNRRLRALVSLAEEQATSILERIILRLAGDRPGGIRRG